MTLLRIRYFIYFLLSYGKSGGILLFIIYLLFVLIAYGACAETGEVDAFNLIIIPLAACILCVVVTGACSFFIVLLLNKPIRMKYSNAKSNIEFDEINSIVIKSIISHK